MIRTRALSGKAIKVEEYNGHKFKRLYFDEDSFWHEEEWYYRKIPLVKTNDPDHDYFCIRDIKGSVRCFNKSRFKREFDIK